MGAGVGTLVCYFFLAFFGLAALGRETGLHMRLFRLFGKPLLCACLAAAAGWQTAALAHRLWPGRLEALPAMAVFLLVYGMCVLLFRVLRRSDINALPGGEKIAKILEKTPLESGKIKPVTVTAYCQRRTCRELSAEREIYS